MTTHSLNGTSGVTTSSIVELQLNAIHVNIIPKYAEPNLIRGLSGSATVKIAVDVIYLSGTTELTFDSECSQMLIQPGFQIRNSDGVNISNIDFESVAPGRKTDVQQFTVKNVTEGSIAFTLSAAAGESQEGTDIETVDALYLSSDGIDYVKSVYYELNSGEESDLYIYYRPPSTSTIGSKTWQLNTVFEGGLFLPDVWQKYNSIPVTNLTDEALVNEIYRVTIPYDSSINPDFIDIRFYDGYTRLRHSMHRVSSGVEAEFLVELPYIAANDTKILTVYGGNDYAVDLSSDLYSTIWDWETSSILPWINISGSWWARVYSYYVESLGKYALYEQTTFVDGEAAAKTSATQLYGMWVWQYKMDRNRTVWYDWIFAKDISGNYYKIRINYQSYKLQLLTTGDALLGEVSIAGDDSVSHKVVLDITQTGEIKVYHDGVLKITVTDTTITTNSEMQIRYGDSYSFGSSAWTYSIKHIGFNEDISVGELSEWLNVYDLPVRGSVIYHSQELPEIDVTKKMGVFIGGNYYE